MNCPLWTKQSGLGVTPLAMLLMCHTQLAQLKYLPSNFQSLKGCCDGAASVEREGRRGRTACRRFVTQVWLESLFTAEQGGPCAAVLQIQS